MEKLENNLDNNDKGNELFWTLFDKSEFSGIEEVMDTINKYEQSIESMKLIRDEPQWKKEERKNIQDQINDLEKDTWNLKDKLEIFNNGK
ncbi:MAG TPA: hypothetical protein PK886_00985 [Candidatus Paceibacterota bacterium]|nr:hypothetical protein [Candidatus Paceibacterota bacterium]